MSARRGLLVIRDGLLALGAWGCFVYAGFMYNPEHHSLVFSLLLILGMLVSTYIAVLWSLVFVLASTSKWRSLHRIKDWDATRLATRFMHEQKNK